MPADEKPHITRKQSPPDWEGLRSRSLQAGGFGEERVEIWPRLLNVSQITSKKEESTAESIPHDDERQIGLDTDRSFVLYPVESKVDRETLQKGLHELLVCVFRKRPKLSYFQGYHDIVTVFFLTLPEDLQLMCVEKISLHRLRDSMGQGLEPVLGLLRVTKNLLQLADPEYTRLLEQVSPMPFYALSNLLTLFAHDMPTLPLIQHVFDYLLCRPPIAVVYLATAIILARKSEVIRLEEDDEDGMVHSLLSSLPDLIDDYSVKQEEALGVMEELKSEVIADNFFAQDGSLNLEGEPHKTEPTVEDLQHTPVPPNGNSESVSETENSSFEEPIDVAGDGDKLEDSTSIDGHGEELETEPTELPYMQDNVAGKISDGGQDGSLTSTSLDSSDHESTTSVTTVSTSPIDPIAATEAKQESANAAAPPPSDPHLSTRDSQSDVPLPERSKRVQIVLTDLLKHADDLYAKYPPSHSELALSSIMGPQSVVFTWTESFSGLPADDEAEAMIAHPELVVYPLIEVDTHDKKEESSADSDFRKGAIFRRKGKNSRRRRTMQLLSRGPFGPVEKKTMLAGTVLVLGVAMAVYGMRASSVAGPRGAGAYGAWLLQGGHASGGTSARHWKKVGGWVGGALAGISQKILDVAAGHGS